MVGEIWKPIKGYDGLFDVSNLGRVKSLSKLTYCGHNHLTKQNKEDSIRKLQISVNGYITVILFKNGVGKQHQVHRLVGEAFLDNPNDYPQINHKDENKQNNLPENLEWCTNLYNSQYGTVYHRRKEGLKRPIEQYDLNGEYIKTYSSAVDVGEIYGHGTNGIYRCCNGFQKTGYGYIWRYVDERIS